MYLHSTVLKFGVSQQTKLTHQIQERYWWWNKKLCIL